MGKATVKRTTLQKDYLSHKTHETNVFCENDTAFFVWAFSENLKTIILKIATQNV